jgi:hypothetical protein
MPTLVELAQTVATGGAATAVIVIVRMFLAHLKDERDDRDRTRQDFLRAITNDLAHQTRAIGDLARAVQELNVRLGRAPVIDRTAGRR